MTKLDSPYLELLKNRINLHEIPFSERGSRLLIFQDNSHFSVKLAERWFKVDQKLSSYRQRPPLIDEWYFTDEDWRAAGIYDHHVSASHRRAHAARHVYDRV